jgi:hypothetical protein
MALLIADRGIVDTEKAALLVRENRTRHFCTLPAARPRLPSGALTLLGVRGIL